jgi:hypothetical protein
MSIYGPAMFARMSVVAMAVLAVVGCAGGEPTVTTPTTAPRSSSTSSIVDPSTTAVSNAAAPTTTSSLPSKTTTSSPQIDVMVNGGVVSGPDHFAVEAGEPVDIWVVSDVGDEVHVHGYDQFYELEPGVPLNIVFVADIPGVFEVELETSHDHLFDIEVSG